MHSIIDFCMFCGFLFLCGGNAYLRWVEELWIFVSESDTALRHRSRYVAI